MSEIYNREIAVKEGVRKNAEIDKGHMKRSCGRLVKKTYVRYYDIRDSIVPNRYGTDLSETIRKIDDADMRNKHTSMQYHRADFNDLKDKDNFKNATFYVYVEKQHKNIYTLRELYNGLIENIDVEFTEFVDIVGKALVINVDKINGKVKINKMLRMNGKKD